MKLSPTFGSGNDALRRAGATMVTDVRLQYRNGFYYAVLLVVAAAAVFALRFPSLELRWVLPVLVLGNLPINTFYFIAGLVLLEKGEGTLDAQVVTPLRTREYLASKVVTLTGVSVLENVVLVTMFAGWNLRFFPLLAGIVLASVLCCLIGFAVIARYDSINEYIFPSVLYNLLLLLPIAGYMDWWASWWFYLHPLNGSLLLMRAAFEPIAAWQWAYAVAYSVVWIVVTWHLCGRAFDRFILVREGTA